MRASAPLTNTQEKSTGPAARDQSTQCMATSVRTKIRAWWSRRGMAPEEEAKGPLCF